MSLTFPTQGGKTHRGMPPPPGTPARASHCHCQPVPLLIPGQDTCWRCGRYLKDTIAETWSQRAQKVASQNARYHAHKE